MSIDDRGKLRTCIRFSQVKCSLRERNLIHRSASYEASSLTPPKVIATLDIARYQKDGDGNLQFESQWEGMCIVIVIAIIERQHQGSTAIMRVLWRTIGRVEFFQRLIE